MKTAFTADTAELKKKVNFTKNALGVGKDLPSQLIRMSAQGGKLTLFAANKDTLCRAEMKTTQDEGSSDGSFAVLGNKLAALVNSSESERISFEADAENLKAKAGFLTVNLTLYDGAALKQAEQTITDHLTQEGTVIDRESLEEALTCGRACTTTNAIRPDVNHVELRQGKMLASDGRKIMIYSNKGFDKGITLKVPSAVLGGTINALKNTEAEKLWTIDTPAYYLAMAKLGEYTLGIRKTERTFPDVEGMHARAAQPDDEVSVDKHVFTGALEGVALGLENEEVKVTIEVDGKGTDAYLEVSCQNNLGRRSHERCTCGRTGTGTRQFPVSYKHLLDTLSVFKGDSVVDLGVNTKLAILSVTDRNEAREVITFIPFRTDERIAAERQEVAEEKKVRAQTDETEEESDAVEESELA